MQKLRNLLGILAIGLISAVTLSAQNSGNFQGQVIQPDGKILIWGSNIVVSGIPAGMVARLNPNGSRDASFNFCGCGFTSLSGLVALPDGKIAISGTKQTNDPNFNLAAISRINSDGSADNTFTTYGDFNSMFGFVIVLDAFSDGKIMAYSSLSLGFPFGTSSSVRVINANGVGTSGGVGITQGQNFQDGLGGFKILPDGRFYVAKYPATYSGVSELKRYNGAADPTFTPPVFPSGVAIGAYALDTQPNGDVLVGGGFNSINGVGLKNMARLTPAGTVDPTFVPPANLPGIFKIKVQPGGKILILDNSGNLRRLNTDGSIDPTFVPASTVSPGFSMDALGRIISKGGLGYFRMNPDGDLDGTFVFGFKRPDFDFDGDGRTDVGIFRSSENNWYVNESTGGLSVQNFGLNGDVLTPADFDGDGETDLAIFRPATGTWWYKSSINRTPYAVQFGLNGDIPLAEDFNGDGRADFVVFRPSNSTWYRLSSTGQYSPLVFGTTGDIPLVADMDGDGKADPTIYRPSTGTWWYASSINGLFYALQWGTATDIPVPGDYDGDGKTDPAYFRPSTGAWFIVYSSTAYTTFAVTPWGTDGDRPTAGDYDGDGKTDLAIYRPSNGMWFAMRSASGFFSQHFGLTGDKAIPNAFLPPVNENNRTKLPGLKR